jgi:two-component system, LytTR family, sensor kinase
VRRQVEFLLAGPSGLNRSPGGGRHWPSELGRWPQACVPILPLCQNCAGELAPSGATLSMTNTAKPRRNSVRYPGFGVLFLAWTVLGVLAFARYSLLTGDLRRGLLPELLGWLTCYYPWLFFSPLIFRLESRFPFNKDGWLRHLVILGLAGFIASYAAYELTIFLSAIVRFTFRDPVLLRPGWWTIRAGEFGLEQALYWFSVGSAAVVRYLLELQQQERLAAQLALEKAELENSLRQAELETLRMRLNPHFLFNCLQNIATLSEQDGKTAGQMLTH